MLILFVLLAAAVALRLNDTITRTAKRTLLGDQVTATLEGATVCLFQNNVITTMETPLDELDEATFTGYAAVVADSFTAPQSAPNGDATTVSPLCTFAATGPAIQNTVFGWYLKTTGATPALLACGNFATPVNFAGVGDAVSFVLRYDSNGAIIAVIVDEEA